MALLIMLWCCVWAGYSQSDDKPTLTFVSKHRVNAHGDEFNALAKTSDGRFAIIGTEKGDLIVWNLASQKIERTLHQPSAVHLLVVLSDPRYFIAAGSNHHPPRNPLVRKWNIADGTFEDLSGLAADSFATALAVDGASGLLALGVADGTILVWELTGNRIVASLKTGDVPMALAIIARQVYVVATSNESIQNDREPTENVISRFSVDEPGKGFSEFLRIAGQFWITLDTTPDHRLLVAGYYAEGAGVRTVLIEPHSKLELSSFAGSEHAWINPASLVQFEGFDPATVVRFDGKKKIGSTRKLGRMQSDTQGRAFDLSGQIANAQGTKAWASYRKGAGFLEFDLKTKKIKTHINGPAGAYAISVIAKDSNEGVLATGGGDGYVRLWNLSDLALIKEYHVAPPDALITDVDLLDQHRAIVGVMPKPKSMEDRYKESVQILLLDLNSGSQRKLADMPSWQASASVIDGLFLYPKFDRMKLASVESGETVREFVVKGPIRKSVLSANNKWLAVLDDGKVLSVFEVATGREMSSKVLESDDDGPISITNDGLDVHQVVRGGRLISWSTKSGEKSERALTRIQQMHTNVDFITLANDDQWLVTAGNHGDIGIFELATGNLVCYEKSGAAAFYAEKAWVRGDRLIFTTDTGVMFDGSLVKP